MAKNWFKIISTVFIGGLTVAVGWAMLSSALHMPQETANAFGFIIGFAVGIPLTLWGLDRWPVF